MRTEQEILKDFEELGYKRNEHNSKYVIWLENETEKRVLRIEINKVALAYCKYEITKKDCSERTIIIKISEHKLLNELFKLWGWIK